MSMFNMDNVIAIETMDLIQAKQYVLDIISESNANRNNKFKAQRMINKARSIDKLMFGMTSYIMAHPNEELKVLT